MLKFIELALTLKSSYSKLSPAPNLIDNYLRILQFIFGESQKLLEILQYFCYFLNKKKNVMKK